MERNLQLSWKLRENQLNWLYKYQKVPDWHKYLPLQFEQQKESNDTILRMERQLLYASKGLKPPALPEGTETLDLREFAEHDAKAQLESLRRGISQKVLWLKKKKANLPKLDPRPGRDDVENDLIRKHNLRHQPSDLVNELGTLEYHLGLWGFLASGTVPNLEWMAVIKILGRLIAHELDCANKLRRYHETLKE